MAVGRGVSGAQEILGGDQHLATQHAAQGFDLGLRPIGEGGQGALKGFWLLSRICGSILAEAGRQACDRARLRWL
jgi:hypothetical protein